MPAEDDHTSTTGRLRVLAPAAAEWPSWWRKNLTPGALYTIAAVILGAVITVTTVIVSHHTDREQLAALTAVAERIASAQSDMSGDIKVLKRDVGEVKKWKDDLDAENRRVAEEALKRNPYVRPPRKPRS